MSAQFDREQIGFRFVEILYGDTLQLLALRHLGTAARWPELIAYNNLIPPYIVDDPAQRRDGVLVSGDLLLVPAATAAAQTDRPEDVLRADVMLYKGRFLFENGDFKVVSGIENLKQGLRHALDTDRGELMYHPEYGALLHRLIGAINGPTAGVLAAQYGRAPVEADDRILRVISSTAVMEGDAIFVSIEAETVLGKLVNVSAQVG